MTGMSNGTGRTLESRQHLAQSIADVLTTPIGSRVMRREFGGGIAELLGRLMTPALFAAWRQLVATAIDLWEPRFRVRKVMLDGSAEALRLGSAHMTIEAEFRPRGHLGDFTVERVVTFGIDFGQRVRVT